MIRWSVIPAAMLSVACSEPVPRDGEWSIQSADVVQNDCNFDESDLVLEGSFNVRRDESGEGFVVDLQDQDLDPISCELGDEDAFTCDPVLEEVEAGPAMAEIAATLSGSFDTAETASASQNFVGDCEGAGCALVEAFLMTTLPCEIQIDLEFQWTSEDLGNLATESPDDAEDAEWPVKAAVVGHVEWVSFLDIDAPLAPGAIVRAVPVSEEPAGGGAMAAVELARLAGRCALFTALGGDAVGRRVPEALGRYGVDVRAEWRDEAQRRATTYVDPEGERTIAVVGPAQAPSADVVDVAGTDAVYVCKGDPETVQKAREARVLCATARILPVLQAAAVPIDVLVHSAGDASEAYAPGDLDPPPRLVATTEGARGGRYRTRGGLEGRWPPAPLPGPLADTYGAGDSFAAALAWAVARGDDVADALGFAASRGAAALCRRGAHGS